MNYIHASSGQPNSRQEMYQNNNSMLIAYLLTFIYQSSLLGPKCMTLIGLVFVRNKSILRSLVQKERGVTNYFNTLSVSLMFFIVCLR